MLRGAALRRAAATAAAAHAAADAAAAACHLEESLRNVKFHNVQKFQPLRVLSKQQVSVTLQSDGLRFTALRRYGPLNFGRYGQWSIRSFLTARE